MSALRSASFRALSPHRTAILTSTVSHQDGPPSVSSISHLKPPSTTSTLSTSCGCQASSSHPTLYQVRRTFRKEMIAHRMGTARVRSQRHQSVIKALPKVQLSSWTKGSLSSVFNGLGAFAAAVPNRLTEEIGRIVRPSRQQAEESSSGIANKHKTTTSTSVEKDSVSKRHILYNKAKKAAEDSEVEREQHTFEKSVEDTNQGILSYHHAYTTPHYVPSRGAAKAKTEEELGGSVFRRLPNPFKDGTNGEKKTRVVRKDFVSRTAIEARTRALVASIKTASSSSSKLTRVRDLCQHLKQYPSGRHEATENKVVPALLHMTENGDQPLVDEAREALALLGYTEPVRGKGIRILALDGGGTRGLMTIQCLKKLESLSGKRIYELFDYACGVSTGALIAAMVCLYRLPLDKCQELYLEFSRQMFSRSRVMGTGGLVWNHAFYDSDQWEKILQQEIGHKTMIEFARDPLVPKMSAISTLMNTPRMKNFLFRNYNLPPSTYSQYAGSCIHELWQVIRASSAAPGYYEDFPLGDYVHSDGGLSINNPAALAVHESRLLWPNESLQCVVSLGTGRFEPILEVTGSSGKVSLKEKVSKIVDSATDTEAVHVMMSDLMPPGTYFRFNPYLSEDLQLDEIREDRVDAMLMDTAMYLRKNGPKIQKAVEVLTQKRMPHQHAMDWIKLKADSYK